MPQASLYSELLSLQHHRSPLLDARSVRPVSQEKRPGAVALASQAAAREQVEGQSALDFI